MTHHLFLLIALAATPPVFGQEIEVFRSGAPAPDASASGFEKGSVVRIEPAPDRPLRLHLRGLPEHQFLKIDAVIDMNMVGGHGFGGIRIVGGGGAVLGAGGGKIEIPRGRFQVLIDGAAPAFDASFGDQMGMAVGGSFPDRDGDFLHLPGTGSAQGPSEVVAAGGAVRFRGAPGGKDADKIREHRVSIVIPHTGPDAEIDFQWLKPGAAGGGGAVVAIAGFGGAGAPSAPFSIKSLTASVLAAPWKLDASAFSQRYQALGAEDPLEAASALNDLISGGGPVLAMLREELHRQGDPELEKKFAEALQAMDDPSFEKRALAAKTIADFGQEAVPLARRTLAEKGDSLSAEVKNSLENLADKLEKGSSALAERSRTNRLHRLLDTLGGDEATELKASLPEPQLVVAPALAPALESAKATGGGGVIEMDFGGLKGVDAGGGAVFKLEAAVGAVEAVPPRKEAGPEPDANEKTPDAKPHKE